MSLSTTPNQYIMYRTTLIWATLLITSYAAQSVAADITLSVARGCTAQTPQNRQVEIATIPSMANAGYGAFQCFEKGTQIHLSVVAVKVFKNSFGGGSVKVVFTPKDEAKYSEIIVQNRNKKIVFLNKNGGIFSVTMWNPQPKYGLLINGPDLADANVTASAIEGK